MTTTLRVIIDQILSPVPGGIGRYAEELTRALIATTPANCDVAGVVSASPEAAYELVEQKLPGLSHLYKSALSRRELAAAWQHGFTVLPGTGMVHATSLLAPLSKHDRINAIGQQIVVTIHDTVPWTHPETLTSHGVTWHKAMAKRAFKYADAVVTPTHAVADELASIYDFGDRIRVIGAAVASSLTLPEDADSRAAALGLPARYILSVGTLEPRKGLEPLIASLAVSGAAELPLLVVGAPGWGGIDLEQIAAANGVPAERVRALGQLSDEDLAVVLDRATVFVMPSIAEGFGIPVLEAFHFSTPVVHSDAPALVEVAGGAGITVERDDPAGYAERLAAGIASVVNDPALAAALSTKGRDRAGVFSWRSSAEKVWQLHADL